MSGAVILARPNLSLLKRRTRRDKKEEKARVSDLKKTIDDFGIKRKKTTVQVTHETIDPEEVYAVEAASVNIVREGVNLEQKLEESLNFSLYVVDSKSKFVLKRFKVPEGPDGRKSYDRYLDKEDAPNIKNINKENENLVTKEFIVSEGKVYILAEREREQRNEYYLFILDEETGEKLHVSPRLDGKRGDLGTDHQFDITGFMVHNGKIMLSKKGEEGTYLCEYSPDKRRIEPKKQIDIPADGIIPYGEDFLIISGGHDIYLNNHCLHHEDEEFSGYFEIAEKNNILFYNTSNKLFALDLKSGESKPFHSDLGLGGIVEKEDKGIQLVKYIPGKGIQITEYNSKKDLFTKKKSTNYTIRDELLENISCLWIQDSNVIIAGNAPKSLFAVYHAGKGTDYVKSLSGITSFRKEGGELIKGEIK